MRVVSCRQPQLQTCTLRRRARRSQPTRCRQYQRCCSPCLRHTAPALLVVAPPTCPQTPWQLALPRTSSPFARPCLLGATSHHVATPCTRCSRCSLAAATLDRCSACQMACSRNRSCWPLRRRTGQRGCVHGLQSCCTRSCERCSARCHWPAGLPSSRRRSLRRRMAPRRPAACCASARCWQT
jgi:hypothetical protein